MGVQGLWQLLNSVGRPVTLESLENKILAVDVSIWLHQAVQGCRNTSGAPAHNAHLVTLFNRICKLLYYKIKPVFVFDGGIPLLKKQTVAARRQRKEIATKESHRTLQKLVRNVIQRDAVKQKINHESQDDCGKQTYDDIMAIVDSNREPDLFQLATLPKATQAEFEKINYDSSDEDSIQDVFQRFLSSQYQDMDSVDINSESFSSLPLDIQHEILSELKESRKRNSWAQMDEMPQDSHNFSSFQMARLLKKRNLQQKLEDIEKEMRNAEIGHITGDIEESIAITSRRILSEDNVHFILTKNKQPKSNKAVTTVESPQKKPEEVENNSVKKMDIDFDDILSSSSNDSMEVLQRVVESHTKRSNDESNKSPKNLLSLRKEMPFFSFNSETRSITKLIEIPETDDNYSVQNNQTTLTKILEKNAQIEQTNSVENLFRDNYDVIKPSTSGLNTQIMSVAQSKTDNKNSQPVPTITSNEISSIVVPNQDSSDSSDFIEVASLVDVDSDSSIREEETLVNETNQLDETLFNNTSSVETEPVIKNNEFDKMSMEELEQLEKDLLAENDSLQREKAKFDKAAKSLVDQTYGDCQELLQLFGIPYIVSPMEAEAQCAKLDLLNLTHGTITDDSDVWLFGGERVYRNFFNQSKYVEFFKAADIKEHFNLDRLKLICLALMTGSDYTDGIEGVGCVTAMEVLSEFNEEGLECLKSFRKWWDENKKLKVPAETPVKKKLRKLILPPGFPNDTIAKAYLEPVVEDSREGFSWSTPDLSALREFAQFRLGWTRSKVDGLLLPVLKKLNNRETQTRLDSFFKITLKKESPPKLSKRLNRAIRKVAKRPSPEVEDAKTKAIRILKRNQVETRENSLGECSKSLPKKKRKLKEKKIRVKARIVSTVELSEDSSD